MKKILICLFIFMSTTGFTQDKNSDLKTKYHQFDFWIGEWDVYKYGTDTLAGYSKIESIIDGVGLQENYSVVNGTYIGKSLNKYNPANKRWEQYWIDNSGLTLFLTGGIEDGKMVLTDKIYGNPAEGINKIVWEKLENGNVRQTWWLSKDDGQTWTNLFDGEYKPKKK